VGFLELALVERVAISLWRQRRLVTSETATLMLSRQPPKIAGGVSTELKRGYGSEVAEGDLQPFDQDRVTWCNAVLAEIEKLEHIDPASLPKLAPIVFEQLQSDAEEDGESVETFLATHKDGLTGFVAELLKWCLEQLKEAEQRPRILKTAEDVKAARSILPPDALEIISRYQTSLDNQLIKGLRALREAQEWRLKTLEVTQPPQANPVGAAA
jgi:hypothetical protein